MFKLKGFLVVALDPLEKLPDLDRLDNFFIQYVSISEDVEEGVGSMCDVFSAGNRHGTLNN